MRKYSNIEEPVCMMCELFMQMKLLFITLLKRRGATFHRGLPRITEDYRGSPRTNHNMSVSGGD